MILGETPGWLSGVASDVASLWPLYLLVAAVLAAARASTKVMERAVKEAVTPVGDRMCRIEQQFQPNGGESMRDRQEHILHRLERIMSLVSHHDVALDVLWETAPQAFYIAGPSATVVRANQAYLELWGFTDPAQAYTSEWVNQLTHDAQVLAGERVAQMFGNDTHPSFTFDLERLDGRVFRVIGKPIWTDGDWQGYAGVVLDLSAVSLTDVEQELSAVEHQIQDHVAWEERKYSEGYRKGQDHE